MAAPSPARHPQSAQVVRMSVPGRCERFFWFIGGFDSETLGRAECRAVRSKYSSMGALILLTALLASCSGGYAIYTIFRNEWATAMLALLWGLMILVLDRFLVSSSRKSAVLKNFFKEQDAARPYTATAPWALLGVRLPIAIAIGLVVSKPIEVRLMDPLIVQYEGDRKKAELLEAPDDRDLAKQRDEGAALSAKITTKEGDVKEARAAFNAEMDGRGSPKWGYGDIAKKKEETIGKLEDDLTALRKEKIGKDQKLKQDGDNRRMEVNQNAQERLARRSVISDLVVIQKLDAGDTPEARDRSPVIAAMSIFLTLLFVLIECMPVIAKALSPYDPYDAKLQEIEDGAVTDCLVEARRQYAASGMSDGAAS